LNRKTAYTLLIVLILANIATGWAGQQPKNIILLIGDGMGSGAMTLGRLATQAEGKQLNMDTMKVGAQVQTRSADSVVTDSAAAGTALATGWKTNVGMVSVLPDGTPVTTILEVAQQLRKSTGLVTTTVVTDATPAVFASHMSARALQGEIATQMMEHKPNVLLGGGRAFFLPKSQSGSRRQDESDLIAQAKSNGYAVVGTRDELMQVRSGNVLGLFEMADLTTEAPEPTLAELADKAIQVLSANKRGFFLMVEGGEIDHGAHSNDALRVIKQFRDFDAAVGVALVFARRDKNTLVIVAADHETGGLAILAPGRGASGPWAVGWATKNHCGNTVPLLAEGPGASELGGVLDNTDVAKTMARLWKVRAFPQKK
jgi:alkaline phosphatase